MEYHPEYSICLQELKNAVCVTLDTKGAATKDDLIRDTIRTMGFARSGNALVEAVERGLKYGRKTGEIVQLENKKFTLNKQKEFGMQLGWIDFSKKDRQKVLDVMNFLQEPGAVDELGIGIVRDAFVNYFFPGTSTIQTRAKYLLIVLYLLKEVKAFDCYRDLSCN